MATSATPPDPDQGHDFAVAELASVLETEPAELRELTPADQGPVPTGRETLPVGPRSLRIFAPDQ